ncbi:MAG: MarR family transcriptional regulator [Anaerolineae bacterium]|nr:MarR family transcriptional regulator [Anaerolineae bacterium]MBN8617283.1 MarR family transcriptional regulator [Anaerolineae bacterium]
MNRSAPFPTSHPELSARIYRLINDLYVLLDAADRKVLSRFGLSVSQYRLMILLSDYEGHHLTTLSDHLLCARSTVTRLIDQLEANGLVARSHDEEDRRAQFVCLTEKGKVVWEAVAVEHAAALEYALTGLSEPERSQLLVLFEKTRLGLMRSAEPSL